MCEVSEKRYINIFMKIRVWWGTVVWSNRWGLLAGDNSVRVNCTGVCSLYCWIVCTVRVVVIVVAIALFVVVIDYLWKWVTVMVVVSKAKMERIFEVMKSSCRNLILIMWNIWISGSWNMVSEGHWRLNRVKIEKTGDHDPKKERQHGLLHAREWLCVAGARQKVMRQVKENRGKEKYVGSRCPLGNGNPHDSKSDPPPCPHDGGHSRSRSPKSTGN